MTSGQKPTAEVPTSMPTQRTSSLPRKRAKTVTEQLLEKLAEAGGRIVKREASGRETEKWPIRVAAARRSGKIPRDQGTARGLVPRRIRNPARRHPRLAVGRAATRPRTGTTHHSTPGGQSSAGAPRTHEADQICAGSSLPSHPRVAGQRCDFLIMQGQDRAEHIPTKKELADVEKHSWVRIPRYDHSPAERLRICVSGGLRHRASEWADTAARPLEDQLAEICRRSTSAGRQPNASVWLTWRMPSRSACDGKP